MIKKKICIIIPYFGEFPNYFPLFLNSCRENADIEWILFTDNNKRYEYPSNVRKIHMTFADMQMLVRNKFSFAVSIGTFHKLCEYKPAYGYLFENYIKDYDFWGYGDIDVIYGKLEHFIQEDMLTYDKIFTLGHLTFIRNTEQINRVFMNPFKGKSIYMEVFSSEKNFNFDEDFKNRVNINMLLEAGGYRVWREQKGYIADISSKTSNFYIMMNDRGNFYKDYRKYIFVWEKGVLRGYYSDKNEVKEREFLYLHLQKRPMKIKEGLNQQRYKIIPNSFENIKEKNIMVEWKRIRKKRHNLQYFRIRWSNLKVKFKQKLKLKGKNQ